MPKSPKQKLKLLYLIKIFSEWTDERHALSLAQIVDMLAEYGITAERKSLYDDFEMLRLFGYDICTVKSKTTGYFLANREFDIAELKLLVDGVQASKFVTEKKTLQLIKKLETLCSQYEARQMRRQVYVSNRIKSMNETIYYNVDEIHTAISQNCQIAFRYFEYTVDKQQRFRKDGALYQVSPFALLYSEENYYLLAYDGIAGKFKHYRVDKMSHISLLMAGRQGQSEYEQLDMATYTKKNFSMFGGEMENVTMQFDNSLAGVVIDRFGKDVPLVKAEEGFFRITVPVAVSDRFLAWIFALGGKARIIGPAVVRQKMKDLLKQVESNYN